MKKLLLILTVLSTLIYAKSEAPKMGCILAQQGEVKANWTIYGEEKYGRQGIFSNVKFNALAKEGKNFKEIFVGSSINMESNSTNFQKNSIVAKIKYIHSKKRIKRGPRHGVMLFDISMNGVTKEVPMVYFYETGDMKIKGFINLNDFNLSKEPTYTELSFHLKIHSIVCAVSIK